MPQILKVNLLGKAARPQPGKALSPLRARLREEALELIRTETLIDARGSYRIVPLISSDNGVLCLDGETLEAPWMLPASGALTALACAVCTVGDGAERRVATLFAERRIALAVALDSLANELLFMLSRAIEDRILGSVKKAGLTMAGELRSGDPGLALSTQSAVLRLAEGEKIGVRVNDGDMMHPVKSTSLVQGVGIALPEADWSRCDSCPSRSRCTLVS